MTTSTRASSHLDGTIPKPVGMEKTARGQFQRAQAYSIIARASPWPALRNNQPATSALLQQLMATMWCCRTTWVWVSTRHRPRLMMRRTSTCSDKPQPLRSRPRALKVQCEPTQTDQPCMRTSHDSPRLTRLRDSLKKNLFKRIHTRIRLRICLIKSQAGLRSLLKLMTPVFTRRSSRHPKVNLTPVPMPLNQARSESTQLTS